LEPNHCDVICERYRKASDNPPVLESTGQTFDEVRAERLSQKAAAKSKKAKKRSAA
jgi:hypothetical protein